MWCYRHLVSAVANTKLLTISPERDDNSEAIFCSTASLIFGPDQTYDYIDCARSSGKESYLVAPTAALATTTTTPSSPSSGRSPSSVPTSSGTSAPTLASSEEIEGGNGNGSDPGVGRSTAGGDGGGGGGGANNTGAIVGGIIGGLALVLASVVAVIYVLRNNCARRRGSSIANASTAEDKYLAGGWPSGVWALSQQQSAPGELPVYDHYGQVPALPPVELPGDHSR